MGHSSDRHNRLPNPLQDPGRIVRFPIARSVARTYSGF
jgi:hypothetical protein